MAVGDWCISVVVIDAGLEDFDILTVLTRPWSLSGPLRHRSAVDRGNPRFWNFNFIIPIVVVRMRSSVNRLFTPRVYQYGSRSIHLTSCQSGCITMF